MIRSNTEIKSLTNRRRATIDASLHAAMTQPSKRELQEMLAEAVRNTANIQQKAE